MTEAVHRLRVEYNTAAAHVVKYYALDGDVWCKAQAWQAGRSSPPTAQEFSACLHRVGGKLDRADGPALIVTQLDGIHIQHWRRDDQFHRTDGPAVIYTYPDGSSRQQWWLNGEFITMETWADPASIPGVTVLPPQP